MWPSGDWSLPDPLTPPGAAPDAAPFHVCRFNESWLSLIIGSLERLKDRSIWDGDTAAIDDVLAQIDEAANQLATEYSPPTMTLPTGLITPFGGTVVPERWLLCDGSAISRSTYAALFSVLGTVFGSGDGSTTFNLPDMVTRTPIGASPANGGGAVIVLGNTVGSSFNNLQIANLPSHVHNLDSSNGSDLYQWTGTGAGRYGMARTDGLATTANRLTTEATGSGTPISIMQPSIAVNFIIYTG